MQKPYALTLLTPDEIEPWLDASIALRGERHLSRLLGFAQDMTRGERVIWTVWQDDVLLGQLTLQDGSQYPPFRKNGICEIVDVWVNETQRRRGIARALLHEAIAHARQKNCPAIGLGVGVTKDFGPAHRLYGSEGFVPDGTGLWVQGHAAQKGDVVTMEEGVLLMWVKTL